MASVCEDSSDHSASDYSDTDTDSDDNSDNYGSAPGSNQIQQKACEYYNKGHCRNGERCKDLHVCKYFLKGNCRYGASCRLSHINNTGQGHHQGRSHQRGHGSRSRSASSDSDTDSSMPYRWQLDLGNGWADVAHDFILEAQYSQPHTKGIRIYNTPCGALSIDFTRMSILKKTNLRVRRKGSAHTQWLWYYRGNHGWCMFGNKDPKGKASSINSSSLEADYQRDRRGTVQFSVDSTNYEIRFRDMTQKNLSTGHKRRIRRRPKYVSAMNRSLNTVMGGLKSMWPSSSNQTPVWEFSGKSGKWHTFRTRDGCSVSSANIEAAYQSNPKGTMTFTVNRDQYILDFSRLTQTNQSTNRVRPVRRVLK